MHSKEEKIYQYLLNKYKRTVLSKKDFANEINVTVSTVDNYIAKGEGVPKYKKLGSSKNARMIFTIVDVASFLATDHSAEVL